MKAPQVILLVGVSGSGKTTVGRALAEQLDWTFLDADDLHSPASVAKMQQGIPLTDDDRAPWLTQVREAIVNLQKSAEQAVIACSALKERYRDQLVTDDEDIALVYLKGREQLIANRLAMRTQHFMLGGLLRSQFTTLEEPADAITIDIDQSIAEVVAEVIARTNTKRAVLAVRKLFDDVKEPEGPVAAGTSSWIITEMGSGTITLLGPARDDRKLLATTGRPNGLAVDSNGGLWITESRFPALLRLDEDAEDAVLITGTASNEKLLWPNDLCIGPDGLIYMTDSGIRINAFENLRPQERHECTLDGRVVVVDPSTGEAQILDRGIQFANGIAIGPDQTSLYVTETLTGIVYRYPLRDISAGTRRVFANVLRHTPESYHSVAGPDGMAFDSDGVLLVAVLNQGTLTSISPRGDILAHQALPDSFPTNLAFGGPDNKTVLITGIATGALYELDWAVPGLRLHDTL